MFTLVLLLGIAFTLALFIKVSFVRAAPDLPCPVLRVGHRLTARRHPCVPPRQPPNLTVNRFEVGDAGFNGTALAANLNLVRLRLVEPLRASV